MPTEVGIQSYTYRKFTVREAIDQVAAAGASALEVWPEHLRPDAPEAEVNAVLEHARQRGVRICGYGVAGLSVAATEPHLRFAARIGCDYVSCDVRPDRAADRAAAIALAGELGLNLAIHNHGPHHHYDTIDSVARVMEGQAALFGACVDTGHFLRAGQDPAEAVERFGPRVHAVHLKDFAADGAEVMPGRGRLDLPRVLAALRRNGFATAYVLEYEADENDPTPAVREAVSVVTAGLARL